MKNIIYLLLAISLLACSSKKEAGTVTEAASVQMLVPKIIYKTNKDYSKLVPIQMNKERTKIVAYPSPQDIKNQTPISLDNGYLFDRRGLSSNSVFVKMTYDEYSKMKKAPALSDLMDMIVDKDPITEMYTCPDLKQDASIEEMNKVVASGFKSCKKIK